MNKTQVFEEGNWRYGIGYNYTKKVNVAHIWYNDIDVIEDTFIVEGSDKEIHAKAKQKISEFKKVGDSENGFSNKK